MKKIHWIGLESYDENNSSLFFGRDREIEELSNSIFHNNQTIIYGPSGVGKSSIIKAGVIRIARKNDFLPVYVRLSFTEDTETSYSEQIITAIKENAQASNVDIEPILDYVDPKHVSLWEFFRCNRFVNIYNLPVIPLIIIDQFEEIFTLSKDKAKVDKFFKEVSELCDNITPDYIRSFLIEKNKYIKYPENVDIRIVFSLREDFLPRLEEITNDIPSLKRNRFSLQAINGSQALDIIMKPEPGLVSENVALSIIRNVSNNSDVTSDSISNVEVEPSLLSLYCSELDLKRVNRNEEIISQELVDEAGKSIIGDFYKEKISHISKEAVTFLETRLLTKNGYRDNAPLEDALDTTSDPKGLTQNEYIFLSENRIIRTELRNGVKRIEFTHDILCKAACEYRNNKASILKQEAEKRQREEEHRKQIELQKREKEAIKAKYRAKQKRFWITASIIITILTGIGLLVGSILINKNNEERQKSIEFQKMIGKFNVNISLKEDVAVKSLWWEANLKIVCNTGIKDTILLDTLINKTQIDSTYIVSVDSIGYKNLRINFSFPNHPQFKNTDLDNTVEFYALNPNISIPVTLKDPVCYGGQLIMKDEETNSQFYLKNAIVVLNNEVDFTDEQGRFLFHLQDTVKPDDQLIIVKQDYEAKNITNLQEFRLIPEKGIFQKIILSLVDSVKYRGRVEQCNNIAATVDSIKAKLIKYPWTFHREINIVYTGSKSADVNDRLSLYIIKDTNGDLSGYYYYNSDRIRNRQYRYHIFKGKMGRKSVRDAKDSLYYRLFELTSYDIANNEETIKGRLCITNKKSDIQIFMRSRKIAESIGN